MLSRLGSKEVIRVGCWAFFLTAILPLAASAADAFYNVPLNQLLKFTDHKFLVDDAETSEPAPWMILPRLMTWYVVLDGEGEAYVGSAAMSNPVPKPPDGNDHLAVRLSAPRKITGKLFWPKSDFGGMWKLVFEIDAKPNQDFKKVFLETKQAHYQSLMNSGAAGAAWFRHQVRETRAGLGQPLDQAEPRAWQRNRVDDLDRTFDLMSGGRAISENLQLDRVLPQMGKGDRMVPLADLKGINVAEIDWKPLIKDLHPDLDPLAKLAPADQHIVLFPSFPAFVQVADRIAERGTIALRLAEPQSTDRRLVARYEQQLGLSIQGLGRIVGPKVVKSVALTGSDPYYLSGSDVALVLETANPDLLKTLLLGQATARAQQVPAAKMVSAEINGLHYSGYRSEDRQISSYVAGLPGAVLLTNSLVQLERFAAVAKGQTPAIASLDEFTFFRNRYPLADKDESALVFLSDATIRRWCGPRWRIAASRETRDAAVLAELQASYMDKLAKHEIKPGPLHSDLPLAFAGELSLSASGVYSSTLGDLNFMTPIAELKFDEVTQAEADAYNRWRDGYQRNWRWAFDPIALRLSVRDNRLAADLTVMPLIAGSEYREMIDASRGAAIKPDAGDRHGALAQLIIALNTKSHTLMGAGGMLAQMAPGAKLDPLGWLGQSVSLFIDEDPFWEDLAKCKDDAERNRFMQHNFARIPVALWAEVSNGFKLTAFLAGARAFIEQTSPGMTQWESLEYRGQPYVKVTPTARALPAGENGEPMKVQLYYVASGKFFLLTPSEAVLKRALDRQVAMESPDKAAREKAAAGKATGDTATTNPPAAGKPGDVRPWLGSNLAMQVDHKLLQLLDGVFGKQYRQFMQTKSWDNLPILNEWRRRYPDQDPVALHERIWQERLICPGGGKYVWNDEWQSMESTVYGCPAAPKEGAAAPPELLKFRFANFGLTFEPQGLRGRLTLDPQPQGGAP